MPASANTAPRSPISFGTPKIGNCDLGGAAEIGGAAEPVRLRGCGIGNVARPDAARREAAHQRRPEVEVVDDVSGSLAAEGVDLAALQAHEADEVVGDRMIIARVERLAEELRIAAEARDVLLVVGDRSRSLGFLLSSSVL